MQIWSPCLLWILCYTCTNDLMWGHDHWEILYMITSIWIHKVVLVKKPCMHSGLILIYIIYIFCGFSAYTYIYICTYDVEHSWNKKFDLWWLLMQIPAPFLLGTDHIVRLVIVWDFYEKPMLFFRFLGKQYEFYNLF